MELTNAKKGVESVFAATNLKNKGVVIEFANNAEDIKRLTPDFEKELKILPKFFRTRVAYVLLTMTQAGKNAFTLLKSNKVLTSDKSVVLTFHEIGHALNKNTSFIGSALQKCRKLPILATPLLFVSLFTKNKKETDNKKLSAWDKFTNFTRNNIGKITAGLFGVVLAEEFMATAKGLKLAKKVLTPELYAKAAKGTKLAQLTYPIMALSASIGAMLTIKIKDSIQAKYDKKMEAKA